MTMAPMLEKDFQAQVVELAKLLGWKVYSTRAAMTMKGFRTPVTSKGFPDLLLLRKGRLIGAELKVSAKVSPEQEVWLSELSEVPGITCHVWRPSQMTEIVEALKP